MVSKAESPALHGRLITLEQNALIKGNLKDSPSWSQLLMQVYAMLPDWISVTDRLALIYSFSWSACDPQSYTLLWTVSKHLWKKTEKSCHEWCKTLCRIWVAPAPVEGSLQCYRLKKVTYCKIMWLMIKSIHNPKDVVEIRPREELQWGAEYFLCNKPVPPCI